MASYITAHAWYHPTLPQPLFIHLTLHPLARVPYLLVFLLQTLNTPVPRASRKVPTAFRPSNLFELKTNLIAIDKKLLSGGQAGAARSLREGCKGSRPALQGPSLKGPGRGSIRPPDPKPKTQNPKSKTQNLKSKTPNPKPNKSEPKTQNPKPKVQDQNPAPKTENPKPKARNPKNPGPRTQNRKGTK